MNFTEGPPLKDDPLWQVRLVFDIINFRIAKIIILITLVLQVLLVIVQIYFFLFVLTFIEVIKYGPAFFGICYGILCTFTIVYEGDLCSKVFSKFERWALDSGTIETFRRIKMESLYFTIFIFMNLLLALITIVSLIIPLIEDEDVFFPLYFFQKYLPTYATHFGYLFRSTFIILGYMMVNSAHQFLYLLQHGKFQGYLILNYVEMLTNLKNFNDVDESVLIRNYHYQQIVQQRIKFCIRRHVAILEGIRFPMNILVKWIPLYSIMGMLLIIFSIAFVFLCDNNVEQRYYRIGILILVSTTTFCAIIFLGQSVQDESDVLQIINTGTRWCSLNHSNLKLIFIMALAVKKPLALHFTENFNVDYKLGVQIVKVIYSTLCFLVQFNRIMH